MIYKTLYSSRFADLSSVVIIDGKIAKNRFDFKLSKEKIEELKFSCSKVMIQEGDKVLIYCLLEDSFIYHREIERLKTMGFSAKTLKNIKILCER